MAARSYFGSFIKPLTSSETVSIFPKSNSSSSDDEDREVPPTRKLPCTRGPSKMQLKYHTRSGSITKYQMEWEKIFLIATV